MLLSTLLAAGDSAYGVLDSLHGLSCLLCGLSRCLSCLICGLPGGILRSLGCCLCVLLHLLLGLPDSLIRHIYNALALGCLIHRVLEFHVGVDHLLDLGLRVALGELLGELFQLATVVPDLAPETAYGLPVEVLGVLRNLLLQLLLKI